MDARSTLVIGRWFLNTAFLVGGVLFAAPASAQTSWTDATGSWFVPGNWSAGVPTGATPTTTVGNGGIAQINGAANAGNNLVIDGSSTVDLQTGGSLTAGAISVGSNGTLLLSGSAAVTGPITLSSGALRSTTPATLTNDVNFAAGTTSTVSAAGGQTLTLNSRIAVNLGTGVKIGSATDVGVVVWAPQLFSEVFDIGSQTYEVVGGTWRAGNSTGIGFFTSNGLSTTVDAGATLDLNDFNTAVNTLLGAGTVRTGVDAATTLRLLGNGNFSGAITGAGQVNVLFGTTILTGTSTYTGGTTISPGGTLALGNGGSIIGSVTNSGNLNINTGGTLNLSGTLSSGNAASQTTLGGGTLRATTTSTVTDDVNFAAGTTSTVSAADGQTLTLNSRIVVGAGAGIKIGSATDVGVVEWAPQAGSTVSGPGSQTYEVVGGSWRAGNSTGIDFFTSNGLSTTVDAGATLDLNDFNTGVNTLLGAGTVRTGVNAATTLGLRGNGNFSGAITGAGQVNVRFGTTTLTGTSTYTGGTTISPGGTLALGNGGSIIGSVTNSGNLNIDTGGTLNLSGTLSSGNAASQTTLGGGTLRATSTSTVTDDVSFAAGTTSTVSAAGGQTLTLNSRIVVGAGTGIKFGSATDVGVVEWAPQPGSSVLGVGTQTYEVVGGTWRAGNSTGIGFFTSNGLSTTVDAGATLDLNDFNAGVNTLLGAGTVRTGVNAATTLRLLGNGNFSGAITGAGQVNVLSGSTTTLTGTSLGGTLALGNGGSIIGSVTNSGNLNINTGGTLNLSGTLSSGNAASQTTLSGGTLRATSTSTVTDDVTFAAGTTSTVSAAGGQTLTLNSRIAVNAGTGVKFGSATDVGVVVWAPQIGSISGAGSQTYEVVGGTWRAGNFLGIDFFTSRGLSTTVDTGATLDLNDFNTGVNTLLGAGTVRTGVNAATTLELLGNGNFSGAITGAGQVNVDSGTTILTGTSTYTGGTTISLGGTLALGNGGPGGSIVGNVFDNGTLQFNRSDSFTFGGAISGTGSVQQNGTGTTMLTGTSTYTGLTTVNAGSLNVNGSLVSAVTVNNGGTLGGNGIVGDTTINAGGTLAPGNSIGLLTVQGNLVFAAASSYMVEVSPNNADRTNVTGIATLSGATVNAHFAAGSYVEKQYTILNATGGLGGSTFNALANTDLPANFHTILSYDNNNAYLNLILNFAVPSGLNGNQQSVANALTGFFNSTGGIPLVFGALSPQGLTQVSGEVTTGSQQATFDAMTQFMGVMTDPFIAGRDDGAAFGGQATGYAEENALSYQRGRKPNDALAAIYAKAPPRAPSFAQRWSVWAAGYGGSQTTDGNAGVGSNTATSRIFGTAVGADYRFSPDTLAGFALAGGGTNFSVANGGSGRSDLFQAGAFVRHNAGPAYISAALAYGWQDVTTDRTITIAGVDQLRAKFNANAFSGRLEGGYRFVTPDMGITPYAAAQFTTFDLPAYAEQAIVGANTFALGYAAKSVTASRSELGVRTDRSWAMTDAILTLRGRLAWAHDFNPDRNIAATFQTLPGASFVVDGAAPAHDAALTTASAEMKWLNGFSLAATFEGEFSDVTESYAGKGVVRYAW